MAESHAYSCGCDDCYKSRNFNENDPKYDVPDTGVVEQRCTGIEASWCPFCGDCNCPRADDGRRLSKRMQCDFCPLHGIESTHGNRRTPAATGVSVPTKCDVRGAYGCAHVIECEDAGHCIRSGAGIERSGVSGGDWERRIEGWLQRDHDVATQAFYTDSWFRATGQNPLSPLNDPPLERIAIVLFAAAPQPQPAILLDVEEAERLAKKCDLHAEIASRNAVHADTSTGTLREFNAAADWRTIAAALRTDAVWAQMHPSEIKGAFVEGWREIASAPKDGTAIIAIVGSEITAIYAGYEGEWRYLHTLTAVEEGSRRTKAWMPLPPITATEADRLRGSHPTSTESAGSAAPDSLEPGKPIGGAPRQKVSDNATSRVQEEPK